jgi:hypothetical protein
MQEVFWLLKVRHEIFCATVIAKEFNNTTSQSERVAFSIHFI